jgi:hypothetical protein
MKKMYFGVDREDKYDLKNIYIFILYSIFKL